MKSKLRVSKKILNGVLGQVITQSLGGGIFLNVSFCDLGRLEGPWDEGTHRVIDEGKAVELWGDIAKRWNSPGIKLVKKER